jgi:amidohydrolase
MMDKRNAEKIIKEAVELKRDRIKAIAHTIYKHPETGYREFETAALAARYLGELGLEVMCLPDIPGVVAVWDTGKEGPVIAILGELDAVINTSHPDAHPVTGAVHACGHHAQIAAMLGSAMVLCQPQIKGLICGKIVFMAVPAEEFIEVDYRNELRQKGIIRYFGGKAEFLHRGLFDEVALCMMIHISPHHTHKVYFPQGTNGFLTKNIKYIGKAAHAGASPEQGINALYAANIGLMAANCLRETFEEKDCIRFHPIITKGGDVVNVIPQEVHIEAQLRGKDIKKVVEINKKIDRAFIGGALAMGAEIEIEDLPGYMPLRPDKQLSDVCKKVLKGLMSEEEYTDEAHGTYSLDMGDLSTLMPTLHPFIQGAEGGMHSTEYKIVNEETAYILSTQILALTALELLWKDGKAAQKIVSNYSPLFHTKHEYFSFVDKLFDRKVFTITDILK